MVGYPRLQLTCAEGYHPAGTRAPPAPPVSTLAHTDTSTQFCPPPHFPGPSSSSYRAYRSSSAHLQSTAARVQCQADSHTEPAHFSIRNAASYCQSSNCSLKKALSSTCPRCQAACFDPEACQAILNVRVSADGHPRRLTSHADTAIHSLPSGSQYRAAGLGTQA